MAEIDDRGGAVYDRHGQRDERIKGALCDAADQQLCEHVPSITPDARWVSSESGFPSPALEDRELAATVIADVIELGRTLPHGRRVAVLAGDNARVEVLDLF